jgi:glycine cleavage system H lipoate-binding protein
VAHPLLIKNIKRFILLSITKRGKTMEEKIRNSQRSHVGYGSSYRRGRENELGNPAEIGAVMGGRVWLVKPDKTAAAENPCIWMQAGIVEFKNCNNFYDCTTCKYDRGMMKGVEKGKYMSWQDAMRKRPSQDRICRHSLTHRISKRLCAYDYQCSACDFDQFFEDVWSVKKVNQPFEVNTVKGFQVPSAHYFHNGHTWARIESGGYIRVGLDDFVLRLLGEADYMELPLIGKELDQNRIGWGFKRGGNLADVLSPVDGVIIDVNIQAKENPDIANRQPYGEGWLFLVRTPDIKGMVEKLMAQGESLEWMSKEVDRLENMIEKVGGPLAADGGYLSNDIFGNMPALGWENLTKNFLNT